MNPIKGILSYRKNRSVEKHLTPKNSANLNIRVNNFSGNESFKKEVLMFSA